MKVHIGNRIKEAYDKSGLKMSVFSSQIGMSYRNLYKVFEKENINTDLLEKIGDVLNYNFFQLYIEDKETPPDTVNDKQAEYLVKKKKEKDFEVSLNIKFNDEDKRNELLKMLFGDQLPESLRE